MKADKRKQLKDYSGKQFGLLKARWATQREDRNGRKFTLWKCFCLGCGNEVWIRESSLGQGAKSCGCQNKRNKK